MLLWCCRSVLFSDWEMKMRLYGLSIHWQDSSMSRGLWSGMTNRLVWYCLWVKFIFPLSKVAPANLDRQSQLEEEKALMSRLKPYRRRLLRTRRQMVRYHLIVYSVCLTNSLLPLPPFLASLLLSLISLSLSLSLSLSVCDSGEGKEIGNSDSTEQGTV